METRGDDITHEISLPAGMATATRPIPTKDEGNLHSPTRI